MTMIHKGPTAEVNIAYDDCGPPNGNPVILLHGGGQTRWAWGKAVDVGVSRGFRMISVDLRGHGESGWSETGDYSMDAYVRDLRSLKRILNVKPVVVGASLGGITGLIDAGEQGDVKGLVLIDIAPQIEHAGTTRIQTFMRANPDGFSSLEEASNIVASYLPHRDRPTDPSGLKKNLRKGADGRYRWHWDPLLLDGIGPADSDRLKAAARSLRVPTLLVRGKLSDVVSADGAADFLTLVPHAELVDIADADHMVAGDRNDAFNDAVFAFLERKCNGAARASLSDAGGA